MYPSLDPLKLTTELLWANLPYLNENSVWRMKTIWTQNLNTPEKKLAFETSLRASTLALGRLLEILEDKEQELIKQTISTPTDGDWYAKQMHLNGRLFQLREVKSLLNLDQKGT